jgi:hypothetical protein
MSVYEAAFLYEALLPIQWLTIGLIDGMTATKRPGAEAAMPT